MLYQIIGIGSIAVMWLGLMAVLRLWPGDASMSYSLHAAQSKRGHWFYRVLFSLTIPIFYFFIIQWYVPRVGLGSLFLFLISIGAMGQLVAGFVPATFGFSMKVHNVGAYGMALVLLPLVVMIYLNTESFIVMWVSGLSTLFMVACWVLFAVSPWAKDRFLYFQTGYIACFHISIIASAIMLS